jgi:hypothetical protein
MTKMAMHMPILLLLLLQFPHAALGQEDVDCPLCAQVGDEPAESELLSVFTTSVGVDAVTCQTAFELETLRLPAENCTFWQNRGSTICKCGPPVVVDDVENDCKLCENLEALPFPSKEGTPGRLCAQLQVDAKRDLPENCIVWQQTVGVYCGCENPNATADLSCRLCGDDTDLPNYLAIAISSSDTNSSCIELEFQANLEESNCNDFQSLYSDECCKGAVPADDGETPSGAAWRYDQQTLSTVVVLAVGTVVALFPFE